MNNQKENRNDPVRPFDDSMWDRNSMYDKMPYIWDPDLNVERIFRKVTGNIVKGYRCKIEEPLEVKYE